MTKTRLHTFLLALILCLGAGLGCTGENDTQPSEQVQKLAVPQIVEVDSICGDNDFEPTLAEWYHLADTIFVGQVSTVDVVRDDLLLNVNSYPPAALEDCEPRATRWALDIAFDNVVALKGQLGSSATVRVGSNQVERWESRPGLLYDGATYGDSVPAQSGPDGQVVWSKPRYGVQPGQRIAVWAYEAADGGLLTLEYPLMVAEPGTTLQPQSQTIGRCVPLPSELLSVMSDDLGTLTDGVRNSAVSDTVTQLRPIYGETVAANPNRRASTCSPLEGPTVVEPDDMGESAVDM